MPDILRLTRRTALTLTVALVLLGSVVEPARAQDADELPLTGPTYEIAREAYEAFERRDYASAAAKAREAIRQRPDVVRLKRLLVETLLTDGRLDEAEREAAAFIAAGETNPELTGQRSRIRLRLAYRAADAAYRAVERGDLKEAAAQAQEAVRLAPDNPAYRDLLAKVLAGARAASLSAHDDGE